MSLRTTSRILLENQCFQGARFTIYVLNAFSTCVYHRDIASIFLTSDKLYPSPPAGVALGLAWTSMGGSTLYIETLGQAVRKPLL